MNTAKVLETAGIKDTPRITALRISNFKRLVAVEISPTGNIVELSGRNASGKTSVLDAIWSTLISKACPDKAIREGADKAKIEIEINGGAIVIERTFTEKSGRTGRITIKAANGGKFDGPNGILKALVGERCLNPMDFINNDKLQYEVLAELMGVDFSKLDAEFDNVYKLRADINRDAKRLKARAESYQLPADCPTEEISAVGIAQELAQANEINQRNNVERRKLEEAREDYERAEDSVKRCKTEIENLKRQLESAEQTLIEANKHAEDVLAKGFKQRELVNSLQDVDISEINAKLQNIDAHNKLARQYAEASKASAEAAEVKAESDKLTERLNQIRTEKEDTLEQAKTPIEGLTLGDGEVLYKGVPLSQASMAEKWRVAVAVAMASNPALRVLLITDGSLLDADSRKIVYDLAAEHDFQVWIELVDTSGETGIVLENGVVSQDNYKQSA